MACTIKSVTLAPSEPYVIPPGAIIIGSSDLGSIESACADLSQIEELECFGALMGAHKEDTGITDFYYWENTGNEYKLIGYELNGTKYTLTTPVLGTGQLWGCLDVVGMGNAISASIPGIVTTAGYWNDEGSSPGNVAVCMSLLVIKTIPSIGNSLKLWFQSETNALGGENKVDMLVDFKPVSVYAGYNFTNAPNASGTIFLDGADTCPPDPEV